MCNYNDSRVIFDMNQFSIDVFEEFGRYNYKNTQTTLKHHIHKDRIEICYLTKGSQQYIVEDESHDICGGDIFIAFPNELHGTGNNPEQKGILYWMSIKSPLECDNFLGLSKSDAHCIFDALLNISSRHFRGNSECDRILQSVYNDYFLEKTPLNIIKIQNDIVGFLLNVIQCSHLNESRKYSDIIELALKFIKENISDVVSVESIADCVGLSESHFKHKFKNEVGVPPTEYTNRMKIDKAKDILDNCTTEDIKIKDVAYDLGFSSPTYFATVFKQYIGISPTMYLSNKR